jgi:hypothetical protein|nr:MAG TPA: hypothetical protein [Caudoviricetes sp.]
MKKIVLSEYYEGLSNSDKKEFRENVMKQTDMSQATFYYKMRNGNWKTLEKKQISQILNRDQEDIYLK